MRISYLLNHFKALISQRFTELTEVSRGCKWVLQKFYCSLYVTDKLKMTTLKKKVQFLKCNLARQLGCKGLESKMVQIHLGNHTVWFVSRSALNMMDQLDYYYLIPYYKCRYIPLTMIKPQINILQVQVLQGA